MIIDIIYTYHLILVPTRSMDNLHIIKSRIIDFPLQFPRDNLGIKTYTIYGGG